jgi:hypothetical protein
MRTKSGIRFLISAAALLFFCSAALVWAGAPAVNIDLNLDQAVYEVGTPVGLTVVVTNKDDVLLISEGFGSKIYYLEMRVIDPAGQLLLPMREEEHDEFPDTPPLAWVLYHGQHLQVADCEVLPAGWTSPPSQGRIEDLRTYYDINLPGYYSVQVQLSAVVFNGNAGDPCDVNNYAWKGVLKSETQFFYLQASNEINVEGSSAPASLQPNQWKLAWLNDNEGPKRIKVKITPQGDLKVADFNAESIKLNNVVPRKIKEINKKIELEFDSKLALESLGDVEINQRHRVLISGRLKSGVPFGAELEIQIIK